MSTSATSTFLAAAFIILFLAVPSVAYNFGTDDISTFTVQETFILRNHNAGPDQMMIRTEGGDLFTVDDTLLRWEFRSSDLWSAMKPGETWQVEHFGWRIGFLSWYPQVFRGQKVAMIDMSEVTVTAR